MAKSISFYGLRTGSTKAHTYQVSLGQQVTKERVVHVANPKSTRQLIQRATVLTAVKAYSHLRDIVDHSWQGVTKGARSQARFMKVNLPMLRRQLIDAGGEWGNVRAWSAISLGNLAPQSFILSQGSLPSVPLVSGNTFEIVSGSTYQTLISNLNAKPGDQLTIVGIFRDGTTQNCSVHYCRIILQPQDSEGNNLPLESPLIKNPKSQINSPNLRNQGTDLWSFRINILTGAVTPQFNGSSPVAAAAILSRQVGKDWLRSNSQLTVYENSFGFSMQEAISYATDTINAGSSLYLNNDSDAENNLPAEISEILVNDLNVDFGTSYPQNSTLVINGKYLSRSNVELVHNGIVFSPLADSPIKFSYQLARPGSYLLMINGKNVGMLKISTMVVEHYVQSVTVDGDETTDFPQNYEMNINSQPYIDVKLKDGVQLPVTQSDFTLTTATANISAFIYSQRKAGFEIYFRSTESVGLLFRNSLIAVFDVIP